jgi:hypothetical protein
MLVATMHGGQEVARYQGLVPPRHDACDGSSEDIVIGLNVCDEFTECYVACEMTG